MWQKHLSGCLAYVLMGVCHCVIYKLVRSREQNEYKCIMLCRYLVTYMVLWLQNNPYVAWLSVTLCSSVHIMHPVAFLPFYQLPRCLNVRLTNLCQSMASRQVPFHDFTVSSNVSCDYQNHTFSDLVCFDRWESFSFCMKFRLSHPLSTLCNNTVLMLHYSSRYCKTTFVRLSNYLMYADFD